MGVGGGEEEVRVCGGGCITAFIKLWSAGQHGQVEGTTRVTHALNDDAGV